MVLNTVFAIEFAIGQLKFHHLNEAVHHFWKSINDPFVSVSSIQNDLIRNALSWKNPRALHKQLGQNRRTFIPPNTHYCQLNAWSVVAEVLQFQCKQGWFTWNLIEVSATTAGPRALTAPLLPKNHFPLNTEWTRMQQTASINYRAQN